MSRRGSPPLNPVLEPLRGFLQIGLIVGGCGAILAVLVPRNSAEFVVSVLSTILGFGLVMGTLVLGRWLVRKPIPDEELNDEREQP